MVSCALPIAVACNDTTTAVDAPSITTIDIVLPVFALGDRNVIDVRIVTDGAVRAATLDEIAISSSNSAVLEVTVQGHLVARSEGSATIAVWQLSNPSVRSERTIAVGAPAFIRLQLSAPLLLIPRDSGVVQVVGYTRGGASLTMPAGVSVVSRGALLLIANSTLMVAQDTGSTWVVATARDGTTDSLSVRVTLGAPMTVSVNPQIATLDVGETITVQARVADRRDNLLGTLAVQFRSTDASVASVTSNGVVLARKSGSASVIAEHGGIADTMLAIVNAPPPAPPVTPPTPPPPPPPGGPPVLPPVTPSGAFVQVRLSGTPTSAVAAAFTAAAARINGLLRSNSGAFPVQLTVPQGACDESQPAINELVPGVLITAEVGFIDGPSGILGFAGPCLIRTGARGIPALGIMVFDAADMQLMESLHILDGVILHEMLHVLGIGTLWGPDWQGHVLFPQGSDPRFTGTVARGAYSLLDLLNSSGGVPVENTGGPGTRGGHWRESTFRSELMTGWAGGRMEMSRITVGALADMGFDVDLSLADPYALPLAGLSSITERGHEIVDRIVQPIGTVDAGGRIR